MFDLIASVCLGVAWLAALAVVYYRVAKTTLVGPWVWAMIAAVAVVSTSVLTNTLSADSASLPGYLAAIATLCPMVALLGAKKPQNRAWQWIVTALWLIFSLPAFTAITYRHKDLQLGSIWTGLIVILILLPIGNYLATRYLLPVLFTATAQVILLVECGAISSGSDSPWIIDAVWFNPTNVSVFLLLLATIMALYLTPKRLQISNQGDHMTEIWREFSQRYGMLWSRRVADRAEKLLDHAGFSLRLGPDAFYTAPNGQPVPNEQLPDQATATLRNLLLRFVSPAWMAGILSDENR